MPHDRWVGWVRGWRGGLEVGEECLASVQCATWFYEPTNQLTNHLTRDTKGVGDGQPLHAAYNFEIKGH